MKYYSGEEPKLGDRVTQALDHASLPFAVEGMYSETLTVTEIVSSTCVRLSGVFVRGDIPVYLASRLKIVGC